MYIIGALAYLMITRLDVAVYVAALQRAVQSPAVAHAARIHVLVRYVQRTPVDLVYRRLVGPIELLVISDSSFKRETDTGHAMKMLPDHVARKRRGTSCSARKRWAPFA